MRFFRLMFGRDIFAPVLALALASVVCVGLVLLRIITAGNIGYAFLAWNLFLAWLPLVFALLVRERWAKDRRSDWRCRGLGVTWLLFFPNAPYIFTDLVHLTTRFYTHFWVDMMLILLCAVTGLVLGFVSLYLMQSVVAVRFGRAASWCFVAGVAGLSGVGVFIGRFLRLNSWDMLLRPGTFYHRLDGWLAEPFASVTPYVFSMLFAVFILLVYVMFYALTRLPSNINLLDPGNVEQQ